jgi:hypothetical protein
MNKTGCRVIEKFTFALVTYLSRNTPSASQKATARRAQATEHGAILLSKLQPAQISEMYAKAITTGRRDGKGGLSPVSVAVGERRLLP